MHTFGLTMSRKEINRYYHKLRSRDSILDLFSAPRLALKFQIIYIGLIGIALSYFILLISSFLMMKLFVQHYQIIHFTGIIPIALPHRDLPFLANFILFVGYTVALIALLATALGIAARIVEELKGDREFKILHMRKYIKDNIFTIVFTPIGFLLLVFLLFGIIGIFASFVKIPYIGNYLMGLVIPIVWIISVIVVFILIATIIGILFFPSIATTWDSDVKGIIFQAFSIIWSRPWMTITGILISLWNMIISFLCAIYLFSGGFWILKRIFINLNIIDVNSHLPDFSLYIFNSLNIFAQFIHLSTPERFMVLWYLIFMTIALAFALGSFTASQTILFIRLKKMENDIELLKVL